MPRSKQALRQSRHGSNWSVQGPGRLGGQLMPPADKSLSHRAVLLAGLANGTSTLTGISTGEDVQRTVAALIALGIRIERHGNVWEVHGRGMHGLHPARQPIDCGNSGTTMRLLSGILAAQPFQTVLVGDASLMRRPMQRVALPLMQMGALVETGAAGRPPLRVGRSPGTRLQGTTCCLPVDSAQVRSAILLAGLFANGPTTVQPGTMARDHTSRMLRALGVHVQHDKDGDRLHPTQSEGWPAFQMTLPGDPSAAAFFVAMACALPGARLDVQNCSLNPGRIRYLDVLRRSGAQIAVQPGSMDLGEPQGSFRVRGRRLDRLQLRGSDAVACIDEVPALLAAAAVSACGAEIHDAAELRVKESDRIAGMADILGRFGARVSVRRDGLTLQEGTVLSATEVESHGDHRIAMAAALLASQSPGESLVRNIKCVATSYPDFPTDFNRLLGV